MSHTDLALTKDKEQKSSLIDHGETARPLHHPNTTPTHVPLLWTFGDNTESPVLESVPTPLSGIPHA